MQRGQLLLAQQKSLLARHQHKDMVVQNIAELQAGTHHQPQQSAVASDSVFTGERCETLRTNVRNSRSVTDVTDVDENLSPMSLRPETYNTRDTCSSQALNTREPVILKRSASVRTSSSGSSYNTDGFGRRITPDVPNHSAGLVHQHTANSTERHRRQSSLSPYRLAAVKNNSQNKSQLDTCEMDYNTSSSHPHVSPSSTANDCSRNSQPANSLGTESGSPLVYMPALTVSVTNTHAAMLNNQSRSPHYFDRLDDLPPSNSNAVSAYNVSTNGVSEETFNAKSLLLKKPNCGFASKSVIANTYLSRRPPVLALLHTGTRSDSVDEQLTTNSHADNSSAHSNHSSTAHTTNCAASPTARLSGSKQPSVAELSVTAVASSLVPPQLSSNEDGQSLSHSSSPELCEASSSSVKPQISHTAVPADISNSSSAADSSEDLCAASLLRDAAESSYSLPAVVTCVSSFVPFHTSSATAVSSVALSSSVCSLEASVKGTHAPALLSSDLATVDNATERPLSEITSSVIAHVMPQFSASLSDVATSFPDKSSFSGVASSSYCDAMMATSLITVTASSEINNASQTVESGKQPSNRSTNTLLPLTVPPVCYTMPCTLTISTHIPVSSPSIDTMSSSHTTSSDVVSDSSIALSSSSDLIQFGLPIAAADIPDCLSLSTFHIMPSSEASVELIDTTGDEVSDCSPPDIQNLPDAPRLYTSSPRMTRRRLSSDGAHSSRMSSPSHAAEQKTESSLLEQTNVAIIVDKTAEELASNAHKSDADSVAVESNHVAEDASFDVPLEGEPDPVPVVQTLVTKQKRKGGSKALQRVSFSPLALLLDASVEGDLELVMNTAKKVS